MSISTRYDILLQFLEVTKNMRNCLKDKPNYSLFENYFKERTNLFLKINIQDLVSEEEHIVLTEIQLIDQEIVSLLKTFLKSIANEQIRLVHTVHSLEHMHSPSESIFDIRR